MVFVNITISYMAVVYLLFNILHYVDGLTCFECTLSDQGCGDPIQTKNIERVDCQYSMYTINVKSKIHANEDLFRCLKTVEKNSTHILFTRRCALKEEEEICNQKQKSSYHNFTIKECSICRGDFCNSSTMVKLGSFYSYLLLMIIIIVLLSTKKD